MANDIAKLFKEYEFEVFRLQTLTEYNVDSEKESFDKFKKDGILPDVNLYSDWNQNIKRQTDAGKKFINTNIVLSSGPTVYQRFGNSFKKIQTKLGMQWIFMMVDDFKNMMKRHDVMPFDFWMFDEKIVFEMLYNDAGNWVGNREITDTDLIKKLVDVKNDFIKNSFGYEEYKDRWSDSLS